MRISHTFFVVCSGI